MSETDGSVENARAIPLSFRDSWKPLDNIRTLLFFVVKQKLDEGILQKTLEELIREHLPILGARIHAARKTGQLEYHIPATFDKDYELFRWSRASVKKTFQEANILKPNDAVEEQNSITSYPSIVELEAAWTPSSWPLERKQEENDCPLLLVHLTHYEDATVVATNLPHLVADQAGYATIIESWINLIRGKSLPPFFKIPQGVLEGANMAQTELCRSKGEYRVQTKWEIIRVQFGFIPEIVKQRQEERRIMLFSGSLVEKLRNDMNEQIAKRNGPDTVVLTSNDILAAILLKLSNLHRKSPKMVTLSGAVDIRGRHTDLPKSERYIHNALAFSTARFPVCRDTPLMDIAVQNRRAVNRATTQAGIDCSLAVMKEMHRSGKSMHICEPFEISYATTNWSGAWANIDFSPASKVRMGKTEQGSSSSTTPTLVFGHALGRDIFVLRYNSQIMCKTKEGFWVDFASSVKNMRLIDSLLKQNPLLEGI
ncbi:uncharacterized protein FOBCDRAFT_140309 [Fusarium oxysporum Fo47]|uniref:uncharacterized protein n=1 Tax=Fusarium oxysporum Fo47 TaxID=660027 RepID=UPI0028699894|nr:uncharacterized protein FOBCDRAFT_140309 [Fusarium oxysporum Fo47]QKD57140.2 hypothetical protein FOBCDRAFT_140309 [Fusarium oxysporum Fo47]